MGSMGVLYFPRNKTAQIRVFNFRVWHYKFWENGIWRPFLGRAIQLAEMR